MEKNAALPHNAYVLDVKKLLLEAGGRGMAREEPNAALESPLSARSD
jgi:hypothetical protein